jgi:magnesium transporter
LKREKNIKQKKLLKKRVEMKNKNKSQEKKNNFETAEKIMTSKVPYVYENSKIGDIQKILSKNSKEHEMIQYIYILNKNKKLSGVISIKDVFRFPRNTPVKKIMKKEIISVRSHTDQERATLIALENNLEAIPVVDKKNKFLGAINSTTIFETLHKEGIEDVLRSAGINKFKNPAVDIIHASTFTHTKKRFPWLLIGLVGGIIAAMIVKFFEGMLDAYILLAAFIPAVVYMADAVGAQSQTLFIRSIALDKNLKMGKYYFRELKVNLLLGFFLALIFYLVVLIGWGKSSSFFALILGISIFSTVIISMAISIILPLVFQKFSFDPAITSGPIGTSLRDLTSLIVYFLIAHLLIINFL